MYSVFFFLLGAIVGSFLNSVIYRLHKKESIIKKRSHCPYCNKVLSWFELIPIMSFIFQKGKCRKCNKKISVQYPLVELTTGILFLLAGLENINYELLELIFWLLVISCLIIIFVYDLKHYIIPDKIIYPAIAVSLLYNLFIIWNFGDWNLFEIWNLLFGILPTLFFLALVIFSKGRWMGMGDVKLVLFMGLVLSWPKILAALFLAFLIGALVSIILIIFSKKTLKSQVPFGPFLCGATIITLFWGEILINFYLNLL